MPGPYPPPGYWAPPGTWYGPPVIAGPEPGVAYVKGGRRIGSYFIDGLIVTAVAAIVIFSLGFYQSFDTVSANGTVVRSFELTSSGYLSFAALGFVYYTLCWWALGKTAGQAMLGMRVVRSNDGGRVSFGQALVRGAWFFLPSLAGAAAAGLGVLLGLAAAVGMIICLFDSRGQGWHDRTARTFVVRNLV